MKVVFLTKYGGLSATTRLRVLQYLPYLSAEGWEVEWRSLLPDRYLEQLYQRGRRSPAGLAAGYAARVAHLAATGRRKFDVVFVQSEALPYFPFGIERLIVGRERNLVVDYDDAAFVPYQGNLLLRNKISKLIGSAREVVAGSEALRRYARGHNPRVSVIPTVVDLDRYRARASYEPGEQQAIVIGWIGTPITARYLATLSGVLQALARKHAIILRCVGGPADFRVPGVCVENIPWREDTEVAHIQGFDIGVMPLADEPFAHGKCGLKLIQYMACGVPAVGARLGANAEIIRHGLDGFLASSDSDYIEIIERLIRDQELRETIGRAGRKTVEECYSLQIRAREFCAVLERAARRPAKVAVVTTSEMALWAFFRNQVRFVASRGFEVLAISSPGPRLDDFQAATGIQTYAAPMARRVSPLADVGSLFALWKTFRKTRPDIVHAHTPKAGLLAMMAAWAAGVKVRLYTIHGLPLVTRAGLQRRVLRWAEKLACAMATGVYCVSRSVRDLAAAEGIRAADRVGVLGDGSCSGVDLERFDPARYGAAARRETRARYGIPEEAALIGYAGRLVRDKGIGELSEAWASLRDSFPAAHLLLCGKCEPQDPVPGPALRRLESDPRVHLTGGFVDDMPCMYAAMDVCVLPSYREGLSTVVLECAAMRTPVAATRIPGCIDLIEDGVTGLLAPARDARALAEATARLLRDPELGRRLAGAAREFVAARYSEQRVSGLLAEEYRRLLAPTGVAADVGYAPIPTNAEANR